MQGCEEKERVLLLWERALTLFYENDTELFVAGAQERTIAGKIAMYMDRVFVELRFKNSRDRPQFLTHARAI